MEESKSGEEMIIWMLEFVEEFGAGRVRKLSYLESGCVDGREIGVQAGRKSSLVLTFVLLFIHLIIIRKANINSIPILPPKSYSHLMYSFKKSSKSLILLKANLGYLSKYGQSYLCIFLKNHYKIITIESILFMLQEALKMKFYILVISLIICHCQLPQEQLSTFALLTVTYARNNSFETILEYLKHYAETQCYEKLVSEICIVWNNKELPQEVGILDRQLYWRVPVYFFITKNNSLNHRFRVPKEATAQVFYSLDDDIRVDCETLNVTFMHYLATAKANPNRFVGNQVRSFGFIPSKKTEFYYQGHSNASYFAVSQTGATFFPRHYLDLYYLKLQQLEKLRQKVDIMTSCQDIFFMGISQHFYPEMSPEYYRPQKQYKNTNPKIGLSRKKGLVPLRTSCITFLTDTFGYNPLRIYNKNSSAYESNWEFNNIEVIMQMKIRGLNSLSMIDAVEATKNVYDASASPASQQNNDEIVQEDKEININQQIKEKNQLPEQIITYRPNKPQSTGQYINNEPILRKQKGIHRSKSFFRQYKVQILISLLLAVIAILLICFIRLFKMYNQLKQNIYQSSSPMTQLEESSNNSLSS